MPRLPWPVLAPLMISWLAPSRAQAQDYWLTPTPTPTEAPPAASASPAPAAADPPSGRFGSRGQWVITGQSSAGITSVGYSASSASILDYDLSPGVDYFLERNISVGLDLTGDFSDTKGYGADGSLVESRTTTLSAGARIAYNVPLGRHLLVVAARDGRLRVGPARRAARVGAIAVGRRQPGGLPDVDE